MIIKFIIIILLNINNIDEINRLTKEAEIYFKNEEYDKSIANYKILIDSFDVTNEKIYLNLAHSHFLSNDTAKALENYTYATITDNNEIKSIALQQIGNINESRNKLEEALDFYKESIISDNNNIDSKFNYELVKKKIQEERALKRRKMNKDKFEKNGMDFSGLSPDGMLPEIIELKNHPWFIGVQYHPEFKSRPLSPHPLFSSFVKASKNHK